MGWMRTRRMDEKDETVSDAKLMVDIEYIKRGVDRIQVDQRQTEANVVDLSMRVSMCEEKSRSITARMDTIEAYRKLN